MVVKMGKKPALLLGVLLVLGLLPIAIQDNVRILNILSLALMWGVVASTWDLSIGYAKVWSFGHVAFFTLGGYTIALMQVHLGMPPGAGILLGGVATAIAGILIGLLCLRLTGVYVALVTFGLHIVLPILISWRRDFTGGDPGLAGFPPLQLGQYTFSPSYPFFSYYVIFGISILLLFIIYRVINSPIGLAFVALRDSEPHAKSLGVNEYRYKLIVFGISAFIAGLMGAVFTSFYNGINPRILGIPTFLLILIMIMLGGLGRFPGAVIGAFVITFASEFLRPLAHWRFVALGAIVVAVMVFMPQGLMGIPEAFGRFRRTFGRRHEKEEGVL